MREFIGVLVALSVLSFSIWLRAYTPKSLMRNRLLGKSVEEYADEFRVKETREQRKISVPLLARLEKEAQKLGLGISGQNFALILVGACVSLFVVAYSFTRQPLVGIVAAALGVFAPQMWLRTQAQRRYREFLGKFDAALLLMASSLKAGSSIHQAFVEVAEKGSASVAKEFARVVTGIQLGAAPGDALKILQERVPGAETQMFVIATQSLMRTGGNLPDVYTQMAGMIVEQREFRDSMRASTAEGRMTAWVITLMPIVMLAFVLTANPNYFDPFTNMGGGRMVLFVCASAYAVGWVAIKKLLEVQVD